MYNLDIIISVGYRVKSSRGTQFRIWATHVLKEHLIKGYTISIVTFQRPIEKQTKKLGENEIKIIELIKDKK